MQGMTGRPPSEEVIHIPFLANRSIAAKIADSLNRSHWTVRP